MLALCMVLCLVPTNVFAEEVGAEGSAAIQLGADAISVLSKNVNTATAPTVYFGQNHDNNPAAWRVIGYDGSGVTSAQGDITLLAAGNMGVVKFADTIANNKYAPSNLKTAIDALAKKLTTKENAAVKKRTLASGSYDGENTDFVAGSQVDNAVFWPLSTAEASAVNNDLRIADKEHTKWASSYWWLRSPGSSAYVVAVVKGNGSVSCAGHSLGTEIGVRPAFNLNLNSVLFTSAAVGGKADTAVDKNLTAVTGYTGSEWKLTLKDSSRSFSVTSNKTVTAAPGGTVEITYTGAETGGNEYVSAMLCDSNDNVLYYGNIAQGSAGGTASIAIPADLAPGNYTLKVFSEQCNGDKQTDYASEFNNIDLNVLLQEETPNAVFTATNDNSGTLSGVDTSMKYSVDGGTTWNDITGETMEITGVTAEQDVKVYKPGDGTTTSDSKVQTIDITQAAQPTGIDKADCTTSKQNNGQIAGVDTTMEYKLSTDSGWTTINANPLTGLTDGTYEVRVKASGTVLASTAVTVTIGAHTCVAQGDWQRNGTGHWKLCACGAKVEEAAHSGGTATCTKKAECTVCGAEYGAIDPANHTDLKHIDAKDATVAAEGNIEYWYCEDCNKYFSDAAAAKEITKADTVTAKLPKTISPQPIVEPRPTAQPQQTAQPQPTVQPVSPIPSTGDTANPALWFALLIVSGSALAAIFVLRRKANRK